MVYLSPIMVENSWESARDADAQDALAGFRKKFLFCTDDVGREQRYFCGNSLGLQPVTAREYILQELDDWQRYAVEGHFHAKNPWFSYHSLLTEPFARLTGALPTEVVCMNTLTANLHALMVSFYRPTAERYKIVISGRISQRPVCRRNAGAVSWLRPRRRNRGNISETGRNLVANPRYSRKN